MKEGPDGGQHIGALSADAIRSERQAFSLIPHDNIGKVNWDCSLNEKCERPAHTDWYQPRGKKTETYGHPPVVRGIFYNLERLQVQGLQGYSACPSVRP